MVFKVVARWLLWVMVFRVIARALLGGYYSLWCSGSLLGHCKVVTIDYGDVGVS